MPTLIFIKKYEALANQKIRIVPAEKLILIDEFMVSHGK